MKKKVNIKIHKIMVTGKFKRMGCLEEDDTW